MSLMCLKPTMQDIQVYATQCPRVSHAFNTPYVDDLSSDIMIASHVLCVSSPYTNNSAYSDDLVYLMRLTPSL